jgi:RNA-directed DNA polymerase
MEPSKTENSVRELTVREAKLPEKVRAWRAKLSAKAKQQKRFRFYSLYGLISHPETLRAAWQQVRATVCHEHRGSKGPNSAQLRNR